MTYVTDPIGDLLTRMRNAQRIRRDACTAPYSRLRHQLLSLLQKEGWIRNVEIIGEGIHRELMITFSADRPALTLARISKPGRRIHKGAADLRPVLQGFGIAVLTTSKGLMTDVEARKQKIGGEVLCTIS